MISSTKEFAQLRSPSEAKPVLKALNARMTELHYDEIQMGLRGTQYYVEPWPVFNDFEKEIQRLPNYQRCLYELFLLGKALPLEVVEVSLTRNLTEGLVNVGLLKRNGKLFHLGGLSIVSRLGYYFIAELPKNYRTYDNRSTSIYIDEDSYHLAQNLAIPQDSYLLDLCTGTGIQAIIGSARSKRAVGVELEEAAATIATYNTILNNVEDRVEIKKGDLYAPVEKERFDFICANAPYLPVPPEVYFERWGHGGRNGLEILDRILDGLDSHLVNGGKAVLSAWGIGNEEPFIIEKIKRLSEKFEWSTTLFITLRTCLALQAHRMAEMALKVNEDNAEVLVLKWKKLFQDLKADYGYCYVIFISKNKNAQFNIVDTSSPWMLKDKPKLTRHVDFEKSESYHVCKENKSLSINKKSFDILNLCNGKRTVNEVVREYFSTLNHSYDASFSSFYIDQTLSDVLTLFDFFEKNGIIERNRQEALLQDKKNGVSVFKRIKNIFK